MLDISKALRSPGEQFPFEATVTLPDQDVLGEMVSFDPVTLKGEYSAVGDKVLVKGTLLTAWHASCCRCLAPATGQIDVTFDERFRKDAVEGTDDDFVYEGHSVSLDLMTLTVVMLELPMRFLCRADCPGASGLEAHLTETPVDAASTGTQTQRPFEALKQFLTKDEEV